MNLYINLTNFNDKKIGGVGFFMKRIFEKLENNENFFNSFSKIYIYSPSNVDIKEIFSIPNSDKVIYKKIQYINSNILIRIIFEQLGLPFLIKYNNSIYFSPNPVIPLFFFKNIYTICTIHDLIPFKIKNKYGFFRTLYIKFITTYSARFASKIITVSNNTKNDIVEILSIRPEKIEIIYNFLNVPILDEVEKKEDYIISICTIEPGKNIEAMLTGFKELISNNIEFQNYKYYIIGKPGWDFDKIYKFANLLNLENNVIFTGYLEDELKFNFLKKAKCLLFLSKYEGFGIPILEALYCKTPCLILNNSSLPEVMGTSGIILESDDRLTVSEALKIILNNPKNYLINTNNDLLKFDSNVQIEKFINLFNLNLK